MRVFWFTVALAIAWTPPASAQQQTSVSVYTENDDWWPDTGTDKNYTNSLRLTIDRNYDMWRLRRLPFLRWVPTHANCSELVPNDSPDTKCVSTSFEVGQQFYTPDDISVSTLIPNDRPYAGWLYVGGSWRSTTLRKMVSTQLYFGFTGEKSAAEEVQTVWHDLVNATTPMGWSHQIDDRFGVVAVHTRQWAFDRKLGDSRVVDVMPYLAGTLGNVVIDGYAGSRVKVGWNVSRDWSPAGIGPRVPTREAASGFEVFGTAEAQARLLAYTAFVDAAPNHDLHRNYGVWDAAWGFGFRAGWFGMMYRVSYISPEYDEAKVHDYKSIRLTFRLPSRCHCEP